MKIHVIHGPNLNLLGDREQGVYGTLSLDEINEQLSSLAESLGASCSFYQSNVEGDLVNAIQRSRADKDGLLINPGGYTHTSVAIRDAILAVGMPTVEVHLSNTYAREAFRHKSLIADVVLGRIVGFGAMSYSLGLQALVRNLRDDASET